MSLSEEARAFATGGSSRLLAARSEHCPRASEFTACSNARRIRCFRLGCASYRFGRTRVRILTLLARQPSPPRRPPFQNRRLRPFTAARRLCYNPRRVVRSLTSATSREEQYGHAGQAYLRSLRHLILFASALNFLSAANDKPQKPGEGVVTLVCTAPPPAGAAAGADPCRYSLFIPADRKLYVLNPQEQSRQILEERRSP